MYKKRSPYRMPRHPVDQPLDKPYRFIALTQGQNAIVDAADYEWLDQWNWAAAHRDKSESFYAVRSVVADGQWRRIWMHKLILGCHDDEEGDHKNRVSLDNRRENLRKADGQNQRNVGKRRNNTSGYIGVTWHKVDEKWMAAIEHGGSSVYLGSFSSAEQAAHIRDEAAKKYHGEFAVLNFPK